MSLQYWHQGLGDTYARSLAGINYVFRGKKGLTFQAGIGAALKKGRVWPGYLREQAPVLLMFALGYYIPIINRQTFVMTK